MNALAKIENDEIVIRVPVSSLPTAASATFEDVFGNEHAYSVAEPQKVAEAIVTQLNKDQGEGTTLISYALDLALIDALESGSEGFGGE